MMRMARRPKLTQEMDGEAVALKADGLSYGGIVCALGIHVPTPYRWIGDLKNRLRRKRDKMRQRNSRLCRKYGLKRRRERGADGMMFAPSPLVGIRESGYDTYRWARE